METATRYFTTIENLMTEVSRLNKELQEIAKGRLPTRCIPEDVAEQCFQKIATVIGPTARGTLLDEINVLCGEFMMVAKEHSSVMQLLQAAKREKDAIDKAVKGDDIDEGFNPTSTVNDVSRLRAVLEVTKTRLDRFVANGNTDLVDLRNELSCFLSGKQHE